MLLGGSSIMARLSELEAGRAAIIMHGLIMCKTRNVLSPAHEIATAATALHPFVCGEKPAGSEALCDHPSRAIGA